MKKSCLLGAACTVLFSLTTTSINAAGTWTTTLEGRDLDGNQATAEAYYDTVLDITWMKDANLALSNQFGLTLSESVHSTAPNTVSSNGRITYDNTLIWLDGMNAANFGGTNMWRLPTVISGDFSDCDKGGGYGSLCDSTVIGEMGIMFNDTLGNPSSTPIFNSGPFDNLQSDYYWSGPDLGSNPVWLYGFHVGAHVLSLNEGFARWAWAVHDGDVGVVVSNVPIPATAWLFASGLLALVRVARYNMQDNFGSNNGKAGSS